MLLRFAKVKKIMKIEELANEFLSKGWVLLPPLGCVVRAKQPCDNEPREYRVDGIRIEIDLSFSLVQIDESGNGEFFDPENIIEFVYIPEDYHDNDIGSDWWRRMREQAKT